MARPRQFNPDKALEEAMHLFWLQGYKATSVQTLCTQMGLKKGSFYDTFGSKRSLFLAALDHYRQLNDFSAALVEDSGSAKGFIAALFNQMVDLSVNDERCRGCLVVNTIVELAPSDPVIAQFGASVRQEYESLFYGWLQTAVQQGELDPNRDLVGLARCLTSAIFGLRVTAKTTRDRSYLEAIVTQTLALIN